MTNYKSMSLLINDMIRIQKQKKTENLVLKMMVVDVKAKNK